MKRCLSLVLSLLILISMLQMSVIAVSAETTDEIVFTEVRTIEDLYMINFDLAGNYKLMNDIDLSADIAEGGDWDYLGNGWEPIGSNGTYSGNAFSGTFDGNGHTISGLRIAVSKAPSGMNKTPYAGLFANNAGTIKNLTVSGNINNTYKYGLYFTGAIAGYNSGTIECCTNECEISVSKISCLTGSSSYSVFVGGIAGCNYGTIKQSYNISNISGNNTYKGSIAVDVYVTGIANGRGTISDCYNTGTITATNIYSSYAYSSGINSYGGTKKVSNCYNIGTAKEAIAYSEVTNCYFLNGTGSDVTGAKSLTKAQMKMQPMYAGFDFENVWFIDRASEYVYPQLMNNRQIPLPEAEVTKVEFESVPTKVDYETGENIDLTGGKLAVYYSDDTVEYVDINENMVSVKKFTYAGEQEVKVYYGDFELSYTVNVIKVAKITNLEMITLPNRTDFAQNTFFDFTGATALATYDDGTTKTLEITTENTTGGDISVLGKQTITFEYEGLTTQFEVNVVLLRIIGMEITSLPTKTTYFVGEELDTTGMVVNLIYNSGKKVPTQDYTVSKLDDTVGSQTITVTYMAFTETFTVEVMAKPIELTGISITRLPDKLEYEVGEVLDTKGLVVKAVYSDGHVETVEDYEVSEITDVVGMQSVIVSYNGFTKTFDVIVTEKVELMLGDVDGDGEITIKDATALQKYLARLDTLTDEQLKRADVDKDGDVKIKDATMIQKFIARLIDEL